MAILFSVVCEPGMNAQELKVDCAAFPSAKRNGRQFYVVFYNVNIPIFILNDPAERRNALERTRALFLEDFGVEEAVYFQVSASYILKHQDTGDERDWRGSFQTKLNNPSLLSEFQQFRSATFVDTVNPIIDNAENKLFQNGRDSKWTFERLQSIIISAQCLVFDTNAILLKRNLVRKRKRLRVTFDLP